MFTAASCFTLAIICVLDDWFISVMCSDVIFCASFLSLKQPNNYKNVATKNVDLR